MSLSGFDRWRRVSGACALLGIVFYAALIPLHTVSQTTTALLGVKIADALSIMCHGGSAAARDHAANGSRPATPVPPKKHCPFCQGFASFQLAIAPANAVSVVRLAILASAAPTANVPPASGSLRAAQSRGPPIHLV